MKLNKKCRGRWKFKKIERMKMSKGFLGDIKKVRYEGKERENKMELRNYNEDEIVIGKRMEENLRFEVEYWKSLEWEGGDKLGGRKLERKWF